MRDEEERDALRLIAAGDQNALRRIYAEYRPRLWSYLYSQLNGDSGWAEELTQDVFVAVWRSAATYRGEARTATWLFRIAHNLAANARRQRNRRPQGERLDADDDDDERNDLPVETSHEDAVLDRLALAAALDCLSPRHREILDLAFVHGFSMEEIAAILCVPMGTVKSRISYARRALRSHLAAQSGDNSDEAPVNETSGEVCYERR